MAIHPTAIVDSRAKLGEGVEIGPWCLLRGDITLGDGCVLHERVSLRGPLVAGKRNVFYPQVTVGLEPQDRKFSPDQDGPGVVLGDDNILREGVTIHRATMSHPTEVGHKNFLMVNAHLGHDVVIGDNCTIVNGALVGGHARIYDNVILGGGAAVHQFCRVGRMAMISGTRGVTQDIPPFCVVYNPRRVSSLNLIGLRRAGLQKHIDAISHAFDIYFRRRLASDNAIQAIEREIGGDPLVGEFVQFIKETRRGISAYGDSEAVEDVM